MTKDKRFLTGLGTGLIIGAILLQLMNFAGAGRESVVPTDKLYSQEEADELVRKALVQAAEQTLAEEEAKAESSEADEDALSAAEIEDDSIQADLESSEDSDDEVEATATYEVTIRYRMTSEDAADAAIEAGLLDDKDAFLQELIRRNLTYRLQIGTFTFNTKPTIPELVQTLTSKPK